MLGRILAKFFDLHLFFVALFALITPGVLLISGWMLGLGFLEARMHVESGSFTREVGLFQAAHWWLVELICFPGFLLLLHVTGNRIHDYWKSHEDENHMLGIDRRPVQNGYVNDAWVKFCQMTMLILLPIFLISLIMGIYQYWSFVGCWLLTAGTECQDTVAGVRGVQDNLPFWREWGIAATFSNTVSPTINAIYSGAHYVLYTLMWAAVYTFFIMAALFGYYSFIQSRNLKRMTVSSSNRLRDDDVKEKRLENIAILPNLVEHDKGYGEQFDINIFYRFDSKIRILIIMFAAIGAYFIVYNTYLQCPREGDALNECANLFVYATSLFGVILENAASFNAKQLLLQLRFEDATVFNYWTAITLIMASLFLLVYMYFANLTFLNFRTALRRMNKNPELLKYYSHVNSEEFNQAIGTTKNALLTRRELIRSIAFCIFAIVSAISFWVAVIFVVATLQSWVRASST